MENKTDFEKNEETFSECSRCNGRVEKKILKFTVSGKEETMVIPNQVCPGCAITHEAEANYRLAEEDLLKRISESGLSKRQLKYSFDNFKPEPGTRAAWRALQNYVLNEKGIFVYGETCGIGKTHLMASLARKFLKEGHRIIWVNCTSFLYGLRESFERENKSKYLSIQKAIDAPVLFIDDIGVECEGPWVSQTLYQILNERYESESPTFITSNFTLSEIEDSLGQPIASRIPDMCDFFNMSGTDHRKLA